MLAPKRVKRRKTHKGRMRGKAYRGSKVSFGEYGLQTTGARAGFHEPSDRIGPCRDHSSREAWREGLDSDLP